ncbi:VOC family protein [Sinorhizobium chiapasense]|uniref:VOC family protein n=1 Tax=Sinorhizobium chiapasense TaxID=501572 RepID=A0ABZ2BFQ8_9HYPH
MNNSMNSSIDRVPQDSAEVGSHATPSFHGIDHIALAVHNLDDAIHLFQDVLGFRLRRRFHIKGKKSGMVAADMVRDGICFVLCQGTEPESQVSQLVQNFGAGLAHVALAVDDVSTAIDTLKERGLSFDTTVIEGAGLTQAFSSRCPNTGMTIELIHRSGKEGFLESNVQELFDQLESSGKY